MKLHTLFLCSLFFVFHTAHNKPLDNATKPENESTSTDTNNNKIFTVNNVPVDILKTFDTILDDIRQKTPLSG